MKIYKISLLLFMVCTFAACKKELSIQPEQNLSDQTVFTTKAGAQAALNGVYSTSQILEVFATYYWRLSS